MDDQPNNNKRIGQAIVGFLAIIGAAALLIALVQFLINAVIDDYTQSLFSFGETVAALTLTLIIGGIIGAIMRGATTKSN
jgi:hypothetical protein